MYSPFNSSSRHDFVEQELSREYLAFPDEISEAYSRVYEWLSNSMPNFDAGGPPSSLDPIDNNDEENQLNTGREFTFLLPGHAMKVYQTLLLIERDSFSNQQIGSILDKPHITIVDDGCGGGTASIALVSLIINYQKYRLSKNLPLFSITINCVGVDTNDRALRIYSKFLGECTSRTQSYLVELHDIRIFPGTLPQNSARITEWLEDQKRIHCFLLAFSNVIRPLTDEQVKASKRRRFFGPLGKYLPDSWGVDIGAEEIITVNAILRSNVDQVITLSVGAYSSRDGKPRQRWNDEMTSLQNALYAQNIKLHQANITSIEQRRLKLINPPNSFHRKHGLYGNKREYSPEITYDSGYVVINNKNYITDEDWQAILKQENLLLAWARVRNALSFDMLEDTIEIKLFEANIEERLNKLRVEIRSYQWDLLNVVEMLNFRVPKGLEKTPRPMSVCRLEDMILATAILQVKGEKYTNAHHSRSFAYKLLKKQKGEKLYESWFTQYQTEFLGNARKAAEKHQNYCVLRTDLSSYYEDINQSNLLKKAETLIGLYNSRGNDLVEQIIRRDCGTGKQDSGIPQGHIISGALSNLYLKEVDDIFGPDNQWGIEYFRFVDDMIFIFPPNIDQEFILAQLDKILSKLALNRSEDKTSPAMSTQEFLEQTAPDELLAELSTEHNFLLSKLYKLGRDYIRIGLKDWWPFVERYQKLLVSIGVYINVSRLSRKLQKNLRWYRRVFNWWRYKLDLPRVKQLSDLEDINRWQTKFNQSHGSSPNGWVNEREMLINKLVRLFQDSLTNLDSSSETDQARARTRIKFVTHRLGQVGFGKLANTVVDLLVEKPWLLHPRRVCHDLALQGREDLLTDAFNRIYNNDGNEWGYIRASILKVYSSLPNVSAETITLLQDAMFNGKTILERTMASESLLLLQKTDGLQKEDFINMINENDDNYLIKNYILLHAITPGEIEPLTTDLNWGGIANEAIEYARVVPQLDQIHRHEPEILRKKFYEGDYPDDPEEFEDFPY